ncbi:hypothetical protein [Pantoea piersonii]|uniref:hypothetical protein n=1 Tax=Pantoea piersonii TaxID=2364647 RepID=UPI0028984F5F|nr:hypothetical protein [Pantoea piersonii]
MMQFTEEQKAALIEFLNAEIARIERKKELWEGDQFRLASHRITLASLTAEPVGYIHKHAWREYKQAVCTGGDDGHEMYANTSNHFAVYTAPPAPALRLPDEVKRADAPCHLDAYEADCWVSGASWMREESERLNATAPQPVKLPEEVGFRLPSGKSILYKNDVIAAIRAAGYQLEE